MELYGGMPPKYHTAGMLGTPKIEVCEKQLVGNLYQSLISVEAMASRVGRSDIAAQILGLNIELARETGCVPEEEIKRSQERMRRIEGPRE